MQKLSGVKAAVRGIVRMQHQSEQSLNFRSCTEQVYKLHCIELSESQANRAATVCLPESLAPKRLI